MGTPSDAPVREAILAAARELTIASGWHEVRMAAVAERAGVSRQTVYNEYRTRAGLADALAAHELENFLAEVRASLAAHPGQPRAAARATIAHVLELAAANPLIKAILTSARGGSEELLPYLTTRADFVLEAASAVLAEWAAREVPRLRPERARFAAHTVIRLVVSHIVLPVEPTDQVADELAELVGYLLSQPPRRTR